MAEVMSLPEEIEESVVQLSERQKRIIEIKHRQNLTLTMKLNLLRAEVDRDWLLQQLEDEIKVTATLVDRMHILDEKMKR